MKWYEHRGESKIERATIPTIYHNHPLSNHFMPLLSTSPQNYAHITT